MLGGTRRWWAVQRRDQAAGDDGIGEDHPHRTDCGELIALAVRALVTSSRTC